MTTTPAMPELPEPELGYVKTDKSNQPAFSARQMRAALQSQPAEVSDAELRKTIDALRDPGTVSAFYNGYYTLTPDELRRAILALRTQADSSDEQVREAWIAVVDTLDEVLGREWRRSHETLLESAASAIRSLRPQAVPMTDEQFTQLLRKLKRSREVFQAGRDSYETACAPMNSDDEAWFAYLAHHGITAPAGGEVK